MFITKLKLGHISKYFVSNTKLYWHAIRFALLYLIVLQVLTSTFLAFFITTFIAYIYKSGNNNKRFTVLHRKSTNLLNKFRKNSDFILDLAYLILCIQYFILTLILLICVIKLVLCYNNTYIIVISIILMPWVIDIYCLLFITFFGNFYNFYYREKLLKHRNIIYLAPFADYGMWMISTKPYREQENRHIRELNIDHVQYDFYHYILPWHKLGGSKTVIRACIHLLWEKKIITSDNRFLFLNYIDNTFHNFVFFPMYLLKFILFLPIDWRVFDWSKMEWDDDGFWKGFVYGSPIMTDLHNKNTYHNIYSLLIFNIIILLLNLFVGYHVLLFTFVVNSSLSLWRYSGGVSTIIRPHANSITTLYFQHRQIQVERATFYNFVLRRPVSSHFLITVQPEDLPLLNNHNSSIKENDKFSFTSQTKHLEQSNIPYNKIPKRLDDNPAKDQYMYEVKLPKTQVRTVTNISQHKDYKKISENSLENLIHFSNEEGKD